MKKVLLRILLFMTMMLAVSANVSAAATTKKKAAYTMKRYSEVFAGKNVVGTYSFELPQLSGSSSVVRKINSSLKKVYKQDLTNRNSLKYYTEGGSYYKDSKYFSKTACKVTYNKKGVVSFCFSYDWYAGGVHNAAHYGASYSLKTGKKLGLKDVLSGVKTNTQAKKKVADAYYKKLGSGYSTLKQMRSSISSRNIKDIYFYLKGGKVIVSTGAYAPRGGNGEVAVKLKGKY